MKNPPSIERPEIEDFIKGFVKAFDYFDLNYRIEVTKQAGFNFRPMYKTKTLLFSELADFQFFDVEGEVRHELVHIIRYENGRFNKIPKSVNYLPTEEGLATLMHDSSTNGHSSQFQHAGEYMASYIATQGFLQDVYEYLESIEFPKELAWQRAIRHKFGFIDTSKPGSIMKPAMYFCHSQKLKRLDKNSLLKLFIGKISAEDAKKYSKYIGIIDEDKLKTFYNLNVQSTK